MSENIKRGFIRVLVIVANLILISYAAFLVATKTRPYRLSDSLGKDHPASLEYAEYQKKYNDENMLYIMVEGDHVLTAGTELSTIDRVMRGFLKTIPGIFEARSITNQNYLEYRDRQILRKSFFKTDGEMDEKGLEILKTDPLWKKTYLEAEGRAALTTVEISKKIKSEDEKETIDQLVAVGKKLEATFAGIKVHLLGGKMATHYFNEELARQQTVITPLALLVVGLLIFLLIRSVPITLLSFYFMVVVYSLSALFIFTFEDGLNPFTQFALLFIFVCAMEDFIHMFATYAVTKGASVKERLLAARKEVIYPCMLTSLTEVLGFGSLILSDIKPIRNFGIYSACGVTISFFVNFYFLPYIVRLFDLNMKKVSDFDLAKPFQKEYLEGVKRRRKYVIAFFAVITIVPSYFLLHLRVNDNLYNKFMPSHPLSHSLDAFTNRFQFTGSIDVLVKASRMEFLRNDMESKLLEVGRTIGTIPNVSAVRSLATYQDYIRRTFGLSLDDDHSFIDHPTLRNVFRLAERAGYLKDFWPEGRNESKMTIRVASVSSSVMLETLEKLKPILASSGLDYKISGYTQMRVTMLDLIVRGFVDSFASSFLSILFVFVVVFRSVLWSVVALIPNVIPIIVTMGLVGFLKVDVEDSLILTMSTLLGIVVNDTIHFMHGILTRHKKGLPLEDAILETMSKSGNAVIGTNLIFILCTPLFLLSSIVIFFRMGIFLCFATVLAVLCDMYLTPALILSLRSHARGKNGLA